MTSLRIHFFCILLFSFVTFAASEEPQTNKTDECSHAILVSKGMTPPELLKRVEPSYPKETLKKQRKGSPIIVEAVITTDGKVSCAKIIRSEHKDLSKSVLEALSKWKYKPATKDGKAVPIRFTLTIHIHVR